MNKSAHKSPFLDKAELIRLNALEMGAADKKSVASCFRGSRRGSSHAQRDLISMASAEKRSQVSSRSKISVANRLVQHKKVEDKSLFETKSQVPEKPCEENQREINKLAELTKASLRQKTPVKMIRSPDEMLNQQDRVRLTSAPSSQDTRSTKTGMSRGGQSHAAMRRIRENQKNESIMDGFEKKNFVHKRQTEENVRLA